MASDSPSARKLFYYTSQPSRKQHGSTLLLTFSVTGTIVKKHIKGLPQLFSDELKVPAGRAALPTDCNGDVNAGVSSSGNITARDVADVGNGRK